MKRGSNSGGKTAMMAELKNKEHYRKILCLLIPWEAWHLFCGI